MVRFFCVQHKGLNGRYIFVSCERNSIEKKTSTIDRSITFHAFVNNPAFIADSEKFRYLCRNAASTQSRESCWWYLLRLRQCIHTCVHIFVRVANAKIFISVSTWRWSRIRCVHWIIILTMFLIISACVGVVLGQRLRQGKKKYIVQWTCPFTYGFLGEYDYFNNSVRQICWRGGFSCLMRVCRCIDFVVRFNRWFLRL